VQLISMPGATIVKNMEIVMKRIAEVLATSAFLFAGCATTPPPTGALSSASSAIGAANEAGASTAATAQQPLTKARRELEQARGLMDNGDNRNARGLLIRAKADADLAASLAREEHTRNEADALTRRAEALRPRTNY
jgi:hypothetical protein